MGDERWLPRKTKRALLSRVVVAIVVAVVFVPKRIPTTKLSGDGTKTSPPVWPKGTGRSAVAVGAPRDVSVKELRREWHLSAEIFRDIVGPVLFERRVVCIPV